MPLRTFIHLPISVSLSSVQLSGQMFLILVFCGFLHFVYQLTFIHLYTVCMYGCVSARLLLLLWECIRNLTEIRRNFCSFFSPKQLQ